jgi:hypothetical protein
MLTKPSFSGQNQPRQFGFLLSRPLVRKIPVQDSGVAGGILVLGVGYLVWARALVAGADLGALIPASSHRQQSSPWARPYSIWPHRW